MLLHRTPCLVSILFGVGFLGLESGCGNGCGDDGTVSATDSVGTETDGASDTVGTFTTGSTTSSTDSDTVGSGTTGCPVGSPFCECTVGDGCDPGYFCDDGICTPDSCVTGQENCRCTEGGACDGDLVCEDGFCERPDSICGDGVTEGNEECDDGNTDNNDGCLNSCLLAACGDGFLYTGQEACDDGNLDNTDTCLNSCAIFSCGDGFVGPGEGCDDGNMVDTDGCTNACALPTCGDLVVQAGEDCDDGNVDDTDACLTTCVAASCGDAWVWAGVEDCDDGNVDDTDACVSCTDATCGDTAVWAGVEDCDDGNAVNTDACLSCVDATCGDSFVWAGNEACDDGNPVDSDGCNTNCVISGSTLTEIAVDGDGGKDIGWAITVDSAGNVIVAGRLMLADVQNVWVRKYDPNLSEIWTRTYNGGAGNDEARGVTTDTSNNVYITGRTSVTGEFKNILIRKYNSAGTPLWTQDFNGENNTTDVGYDVAVDGSGNLITAGETNTVNNGTDMWVRKSDSNGVEIWTKLIGLTGIPTGDKALGVATGPGDVVYVTGEFRNGKLPSESSNIFIRQYSAAGSTQWWYELSYPDNLIDKGEAVVVDSTGAAIIAGRIRSATQGDNVWLKKYLPSGVTAWSGQIYDGADSLDDVARAVAIAPDNTIVIAGEEERTATMEDVLVRKYAADGSVLWSDAQDDGSGLTDRAYGVAVGPDGSIYVTGQRTFAGASDVDILIQKRAP